jgi:hypothetical protein
MKKSRRYIASLLLATIYLLIIFSPLMPLAGHTKLLVHAASGECSGDCRIDGCSLERSAAQTCCCSKKRQVQARVHEDAERGSPDCCKKKPVEKKVVIASCGCPCGSGKQNVLPISTSSEVLPFCFTEQLTIADTNTTFSTLIHRLTSRLGEPPDPPPQNS